MDFLVEVGVEDPTKVVDTLQCASSWKALRIVLNS